MADRTRPVWPWGYTYLFLLTLRKWHPSPKFSSKSLSDGSQAAFLNRNTSLIIFPSILIQSDIKSDYYVLSICHLVEPQTEQINRRLTGNPCAIKMPRKCDKRQQPTKKYQNKWLSEFSNYLLILFFIHLQSKQKIFMLRNKTRHADTNLVKTLQTI